MQVKMISFLLMWPPDSRSVHRLLKKKGFAIVDKFLRRCCEGIVIFKHVSGPRELRMRGMQQMSLCVHAEAKTGFFGAPSKRRRRELMQIQSPTMRRICFPLLEDWDHNPSEFSYLGEHDKNGF